MKTLTQALSTGSASGSALPPLSPTLAANGVVIRRGQVTMLAAVPNGMKTFLAGAYVLSSGLRTLFVSADTDYWTMTRRFAASILHVTQDDVEKMMNGGQAAAVEAALEESLEHVAWCFDPSPTLDDLIHEMQAFEEMWGAPPELVVVDSLYNVVAETGEEWAGMREVMKALHHVARVTEAAVMVLHHTSESEGNPFEPQPRKAVMGKVAQLPELILTLAYDPNAGELKVAAVKNRNGVADASGKRYTTLYADPARSLLSDNRQVVALARQREAWT